MISEFLVNPIRLQTRFLFRLRLEVETNKLTSTSCPEKILNVWKISKNLKLTVLSVLRCVFIQLDMLWAPTRVVF